MIEDIEKSLNESFKELFYNNFTWLIWVFVIAIVFVIVIHIAHCFSNAKDLNKINLRIAKLENKLNNLTKNHNIVAEEFSSTTLDDIAAEIKEIKSNLKH